MGFFSYFALGIHLKPRSSGYRNTIFEGNWDKYFAHFGSKIGEYDFFRTFYFS